MPQHDEEENNQQVTITFQFESEVSITYGADSFKNL